jgi:hypothetical protein
MLDYFLLLSSCSILVRSINYGNDFRFYFLIVVRQRRLLKWLFNMEEPDCFSLSITKPCSFLSLLLLPSHWNSFVWIVTSTSLIKRNWKEMKVQSQTTTSFILSSSCSFCATKIMILFCWDSLHSSSSLCALLYWQMFLLSHLILRYGIINNKQK